MSHKALVFAVLAAVAIVAIAVISRAKATPPLTLSPNEFVAVRTAQVQLLQAQQNLGKSKEWNDLQAAQGELNKAIDSVWTVRKLDRAQYVLCDGPITDPGVPAPTVAACSGLMKGELAIRALPKSVPPVAK